MRTVQTQPKRHTLLSPKARAERKAQLLLRRLQEIKSTSADLMAETDLLKEQLQQVMNELHKHPGSN